MRIGATVVSIKSQIAKHSLVSFHLLDRDMALSLTVFLIDWSCYWFSVNGCWPDFRLSEVQKQEHIPGNILPETLLNPLGEK